MTERLAINLIEEISVCANGQPVCLVSSRKTRALLAYLLVNGRAQRREHLCELFFDTTSDPRGSLRWSLTKLRKTLNDGAERLVTSSDMVSVDMDLIDLDIHQVHAVHNAPNPPTEDLRRAVTLLSQKPYAELEVANLDDYSLWLLGEREQLRSMRGTLIQRLVDAQDVSDQEALKWLRTWSRLESYSHHATRALAQKLTALQLNNEAEKVIDQYRRLMGPEACEVNVSEAASLSVKNSLKRRQSIGFCKAADGVKIAYATVGKGPPLVKAANWLNHLELDWDSPIWGDTFRALAENHTFVRYDERGNGLSDWDVPEISQRAFVEDLETVVDNLGLDRFPLLGMSQGCAVSIEYAVKHPSRVSALILFGGYASGWRIGLPKQEQEQREAVLTLTRLGWGTSNPAYRHIFSRTFMPNADAERLAWFDDFQRQTTSPENAVRFQEAFGDIDVRHLLSQVKTPTLVLHAREDQRIPLSCSRELAGEIPNAELVTLESQSHILLGDEPAWHVCMDEINRFLAKHRNG